MTISKPPLSVAIVGAGPSGLCAAIRLLEDVGVKQLTLYESSSGVGGTWFRNTYPGAACDVEAVGYSYSFRQKSNWSCTFAGQKELLAYFSSVAEENDLHSRIRFGTTVTGATWDESASLWRLELSIVSEGGGAPVTSEASANILIAATGPLCIPHVPEFPGLESFGGSIMHSAEWDDSVKIKGQKVAMVGTAASAAQIGPAIVEDVEKLLVFQRTPNWMVPRLNFEYPSVVKFAFQYIPGFQRFWRTMLYLRRDLLFFRAFKPGSRPQKLAAKFYGEWMAKQIPAERHAELLPTYAFGCKRVVVSSTFLSTLTHPSTEVVTDSISSIDQSGIVTTEGTHHDVDVIVMATGFKIHPVLSSIKVVGRDGLVLSEQWSKEGGATAYLGTAVAGFPNFYTLLGPFTGLGHASVLTIVECQVNMITKLIRRQLETSTAALAVKPEAEKQFVEEARKALVNTVWQQGGCVSWYMTPGSKTPAALWPWTVFWFWWRTRSPTWQNFTPEMGAPPPNLRKIGVIMAAGMAFAAIIAARRGARVHPNSIMQAIQHLRGTLARLS
ncbi:hypothetical protein HKX48_000179 [Thoreauomyces humboldtii]|nr:hypothetical protein HKX48_000179 [Thoreauomyces humboldtii]